MSITNFDKLRAQYDWKEHNRAPGMTFEEEIEYMAGLGYALVPHNYHIPHWFATMSMQGVLPTIYVHNGKGGRELSSHFDCFAKDLGYPVYFKRYVEERVGTAEIERKADGTWNILRADETCLVSREILVDMIDRCNELARLRNLQSVQSEEIVEPCPECGIAFEGQRGPCVNPDCRTGAQATPTAVLSTTEAWEKLMSEGSSWQRIAKEMKRLALSFERWKLEQLAVEREWNPQAVADLLDIPIGKSIRKNIPHAIKRIKEESAAIKAQLDTCYADRERLAEVVREYRAALFDGPDNLSYVEHERLDHRASNALASMGSPVVIPQPKPAGLGRNASLPPKEYPTPITDGHVIQYPDGKKDDRGFVVAPLARGIEQSLAEAEEKVEYAEEHGLRIGKMVSSDCPEGYLAHEYVEGSTLRRMFDEWSNAIGLDSQLSKVQEQRDTLALVLHTIAHTTREEWGIPLDPPAFNEQFGDWARRMARGVLKDTYGNMSEVEKIFGMRVIVNENMPKNTAIIRDPKTGKILAQVSFDEEQETDSSK